MEYNRSINAVIIGYVLNFLLLAAAIEFFGHRDGVGVFVGIMAILSLASAYFHEAAVGMLSVHKPDEKSYRLPYRIFKITSIATPLTAVVGYIVLFIALIAGV